MGLDVNLKIGSQVGFRRSSTATLAFSTSSVGVGGINGPRPVVTTIYTLNEEVIAEPAITGTRILTVSTTTAISLYPGQTSAPQSVYITNEGNADLSLVFPFVFPSQDGATFNFINFTPNDGIAPLPITPGNTGTLSFSYTAGNAAGEYINYFLIFTNADNPQFKVLTRQIISEQFNAQITPLSYSTTTNAIGERSYVSYILTPVLNGQVIDRTIDFTYALTTGTGWKVYSTGTNVITLEFESNDVRNVNGTYFASLDITVADATVSLPNTAVVAIDPDKNYNLFQWQSPIAPHNSVIGISYDVIKGEKALTIAVGAGGDGTTDYDQDGKNFIKMQNIGLGGDNMDYPYIFWAEAYRFRGLGTGTAKTYLSGGKDPDGNFVYQEKFTEERNYGSYFGTERSFQSMFIVNDDGLGNLTINLNSIREYTGDEAFDTTLDNLTRAFHYYSEGDVGGRIQNLIQYPIVGATVPPTTPATTSTVTPLGEVRTKLFRGIDYVTRFANTTVTNTATTGSTTISLTTVTGIAVGDIIQSVGTQIVEGRSIGVLDVSSATNVVTLNTSLPFTIAGGQSITIKNPVVVRTSLVNFPK